jgi:hypothetical protein
MIDVERDTGINAGRRDWLTIPGGDGNHAAYWAAARSNRQAELSAYSQVPFCSRFGLTRATQSAQIGSRWPLILIDGTRIGKEKTLSAADAIAMTKRPAHGYPRFNRKSPDQ